MEELYKVKRLKLQYHRERLRLINIQMIILYSFNRTDQREHDIDIKLELKNPYKLLYRVA